MNDVVFGVQPVLEALRAGRRVERVIMARGTGPKTRRVREAARRAGVMLVEAGREELARRARTDHHQGVVALLEPDDAGPVEVDDLVDAAEAAGEAPLIVLLDGIQDPQNLGAILRSAYVLGAHGAVLPKNRACAVTPAVIRASAGAALHLPVARVVNLKHALDRLRDRGVWSAAAVMDGAVPSSVRLDGPLALVVGSEAEGVRPTLAARCDDRVSIPMDADFDSLNVSVAAGILLYEARRQRLDKDGHRS